VIPTPIPKPINPKHNALKWTIGRAKLVDIPIGGSPILKKINDVAVLITPLSNPQ
jgi:hypothetical protein